MEYILIGKIVNAVGIKGELRVYNYSDEGGFDGLEHVFLKYKREYTEYSVEKSRLQKNMVVLKLKGVDDRNMAEKLKEREVYITEEDLRELPEDTYYIRDMIGMSCVHDENGEFIGELVDVLQNSAQDNYEIKMEDGRIIYIPAVGDFVKKVDMEAREIRFTLIPGFIDDAVEA